MSVEFELARVPILRPWFDPYLMFGHSWKYPGQTPENPEPKERISDGRTPPAGSMPVHPQEVILARNIRVKLDTRFADNMAFVANLKANGSFGYGPFKISGDISYGGKVTRINTKVTEDSIFVETMQVIGFLCSVAPRSPTPTGPSSRASRRSTRTTRAADPPRGGRPTVARPPREPTCLRRSSTMRFLNSQPEYLAIRAFIEQTLAHRPGVRLCHLPLFTPIDEAQLSFLSDPGRVQEACELSYTVNAVPERAGDRITSSRKLWDVYRYWLERSVPAPRSLSDADQRELSRPGATARSTARRIALTKPRTTR